MNKETVCFTRERVENAGLDRAETTIDGVSGRKRGEVVYVELWEADAKIKDENTQAVGVPVDGDDLRYLCVIMPMRV